MVASKPLTAIGLLIGCAALLLQFVLSMQAYIALGRDIFGALGMFFAFYTILSNTALVLVYLSDLTSADWLSVFRHPIARAAMAANIALVSLYVFFVLRFLVELNGLPLIADAMLHYLAPVIYIVWWLTTQRDGALKWSDFAIMLVPALIYFLYVLARGAWVQEYPYPILNAIKLGYGQVLVNAVYMTLALATLCLITIALDKFLARSTRTVA